MESLLPLLKIISSNNPNLNIENIEINLIDFSSVSGILPLLKHYSRYAEKKISSTYSTLLKSADLTAKIITHIQLDAIRQLAEYAINSSIDRITLLKGIAVCKSYYPQPHLRIMADIDILVSKQDIDTLKKILRKLNYKQISEQSETFYKTHHHIMPFYNESNNVWIEVHTHLFSGQTQVQFDNVFNLQHLYKNSIQAGYNYPDFVYQLCPELQLIYTCTHWAEELKINKSCLQMIDVIQIIINENLDYEKLLSWINNTTTASYIYLLFNYYNKNNLVILPAKIENKIILKHQNMGRLNRNILHYIINNYVMGKKPYQNLLNKNNIKIIWNTLLQPAPSYKNLIHIPWNITFPPESSGRYRFTSFIGRLKTLIRSCIRN